MNIRKDQILNMFEKFPQKCVIYRQTTTDNGFYGQNEQWNKIKEVKCIMRERTAISYGKTDKMIQTETIDIYILPTDIRINDSVEYRERNYKVIRVTSPNGSNIYLKLEVQAVD